MTQARRASTPAERARAAELRAQGLSYAAIGRELGRDQRVVRIWADPAAKAASKEVLRRFRRRMQALNEVLEAVTGRERRRRRPSTREERGLAVELSAKGLGPSAIGRELGRDRRLIQRWLEQA